MKKKQPMKPKDMPTKPMMSGKMPMEPMMETEKGSKPKRGKGGKRGK